MGDTDKKGSGKLLELLAHSKEITVGILVVLSLIGGIYGSFRPENDARAGYGKLAPELKTTADLADENAVILDVMAEKVLVLEAQMQVMINSGRCMAPEKITVSDLPADEIAAPKEPLPEPQKPSRRSRNKSRSQIRLKKERDLTPPWEQRQSK